MKVTVHDSGVADFLRSAEVRRALKNAGDEFGDEVEQQAQRFAKTGDFAGSIEVEDVEPTPDGAKVTILSTDPDAHIVEFGSVNNPPYAPFRKAAESLGLKMRDTGR